MPGHHLPLRTYKSLDDLLAEAASWAADDDEVEWRSCSNWACDAKVSSGWCYSCDTEQPENDDA